MLGKNGQGALRKVYLTIVRGHIERTFENGEKEEYSFVEGNIERVHYKDRTFKGESVRYWYVDLRDGEELYSVGLPLYSGTLRSLVLCLADDKELQRGTPVRIEPYEKEGFTKVVVYTNGVKRDWATKELPPVESVQVGSKIVKDESKRDAFIEQLLKDIQERLQGAGVGSQE